MAIAVKMRGYLDKGSMIRKMFEEGARLKKLYGDDKVFDFSIGNPNVAPPPELKECLARLVASEDPSLHAYMPNAGLPEARKAIADRLAREQGVSLGPANVVVTCGASGAL